MEYRLYGHEAQRVSGPLVADVADERVSYAILTDLDDAPERLGAALGDGVLVISIASWFATFRYLEGAPKDLGAGRTPDVGNVVILGALLSAGFAESENAAEIARVIGDFHIPVLDVPDGKAAVELVNPWVQNLLLERLRAASSDFARERGASATLRTDLMRLQDNFDSLVAFIDEANLAPFVLALDLAYAGKELTSAVDADRVGDRNRDFEIIQPLPVSGASVAAVEIYLTQLLSRGDGGLVVEVGGPDEALDEAVAIETAWRDLTLGWNRIVLPRPLSGDPLDAVLKLRCRLDDGEIVGFGLSDCAPMPAFHLSSSDGAHSPATLAVRVWRGIPGVMLPAVERGPSLDRELRTRLLSPSDCPAPELLSSPAEHEEWVGTAYWPNENAILVHATVKGAVTAIIRNIAVEDLVALSATVHNAHGAAPILGFKLEVALQDGAVGATATNMSGITLLPDRWGEVHCVLDRPYSGLVDLKLTTTAHGPTSHYAWGLFRGFRFRCAGSAA